MQHPSTLTAAFAYFGVKLRNVRQSWSGTTPDGQLVVLTLWEDRIRPDGSVDFFGGANAARWQATRGNKWRIQDLKTALENCGGRFRVVRVKAKDVNAIPRQIDQRWPDPDTIMQITRFDEETGEFAAIKVK